MNRQLRIFLFVFFYVFIGLIALGGALISSAALFHHLIKNDVAAVLSWGAAVLFLLSFFIAWHDSHD